jgi:two-component system cell cycle sensor histidine kinase/response regulator CckA
MVKIFICARAKTTDCIMDYRRRIKMNPLSVLHVEDSPEDSELIGQSLVTAELPAQIKRVETAEQVFAALEHESFDLILADFKLPGFSGLQALDIAHALKPEIPFIFVSGTIGEDTAIESLRNGATDYVLKDRLSRLAPAVRRALGEAEERTLCRQLQHRLREAGRLEAISTLSNGIAHDFNNILTIILGHAALLSMENDNPDRVLQISGTISEAARRGSEIVQQLLAFARKSDGHAAPADLNHYVRASMDVLREKLPREVELMFQPAVNLPEILVDASQLERILLNLVTNSIDAMASGGRLVLSTKLVPGAELPDLLPKLSAEKYVCLMVADTGKGIDSTTREHGLGLPVVYGLMLAHGGYVDVQSEPGEGTTISLFFPVPKIRVGSPAAVVRSADPSVSGSEVILVVEDEADVSFFLETMLRSHGYHVLCAADAEQAIHLFKERQDEIQLVFSDIGLPKVDGITLGERLRTLKPSLPLILSSGYPTKEFKPRIYKLRPDAFLSKPYTTQDILTTVRKTLDAFHLLHLAD